MTKVKAIAIRRVSSKKQEENNHSLEQQDTSVQNMASVLDAIIVKDWAMATSAKKGKNLKRKDLQQALAYCRYNRGVKYLLIDKVSRFGRELKIIFYYIVLFEQLGVRVIFCDPSQQKFNADTAEAMYELARKAYQAESENEERAETTTTKMQERVRLGYYPFYPHQGYKKTEFEDGLHVPDQPRFELLQVALKATASFQMTPEQTVQWLYMKGYRTPIIYRKDENGVKHKKGERKLDLWHFREIMKDIYYAGSLRIKGWPENEHGKHDTMISNEEWEINTAIANGQPIRRKLQFNPEFRLNLSYHAPCTSKTNVFAGRLTGINHSNGRGWTRKEYVCRTCKRRVSQESVHDSMDELLGRIRPHDRGRKELMDALKHVWKINEQYRIESLEQYKLSKEALVKKKSELITTLSDNPELKIDILDEITRIKSDIIKFDNRIASLGKVEEDFVEFMEYALGYSEELCKKWWDLPAGSLKECKQLIFNDNIQVQPTGIVYTPNLSPIYSLYKAKSDSKVAQNCNMVELVGTAPTSAGLSVVNRLQA